MITNETVVEYVRKILGLDESEDGILMLYCSAGLENVQSKVRDGADKNSKCILIAAVSVALYKCILARCTAIADGSFKAGDITVSTDNGISLDAAKRFMELSVEDAAYLLEDTSFSFCSVGG